MTRKKLVFIIAVLLVIVAIFLLRFGLGGPEDTWICRDHQWVRHGHPSGFPPPTGCLEQN